MKIAIPCVGETVAPRLEYSATISIVTVEKGRVVDQFDFPIRSQEALDRIRLLRDQQVDTIICGGVQNVFEDMLRASGFEVISWVSGNIKDLLGLFLQGKLVSGSPSGHPAEDESPHQNPEEEQP